MEKAGRRKEKEPPCGELGRADAALSEGGCGECADPAAGWWKEEPPCGRSHGGGAD